MGRLDDFKKTAPESRIETLKRFGKFSVECLSGNIKNRVLLVADTTLGTTLYYGGEIETVIAFTAFLGAVLVCGGGRATKLYYDITKKHIKRTGTVDARFLSKVMNGYQGTKLLGYCELQGVYLAARNNGLSSEFKAAKKQSGMKVLIPNI
ncbi:MAG: hypothetical protein HHAS10_00920 [Candidatus Altimarinota bacterium]